MIEIGAKICIKGVWDQTPTPSGRVDVLLNPNFAFGTGGHPVTKAILEEMELLIVGGEVVLDVGTGSGVLAIAAIRLGAMRVYATDNNQDAVDAAAANVESNGLQAAIEVVKGNWPDVAVPQADLVVMNIDRIELILNTLPVLDLKSSGHFIVTPSADDQTEIEAAAVVAGMTLLRTRAAGEYMRPAKPGRPAGLAAWKALVFQKS